MAHGLLSRLGHSKIRHPRPVSVQGYKRMPGASITKKAATLAFLWRALRRDGSHFRLGNPMESGSSAHRGISWQILPATRFEATH